MQIMDLQLAVKTEDSGISKHCLFLFGFGIDSKGLTQYATLKYWMITIA